MADYELISYSGQLHAYKIEENGLDLMFFIEKEKERLNISNSENLTITIEERGDDYHICNDTSICKVISSLLNAVKTICVCFDSL